MQGDKTGDKPLSEMVKDYLREKYNKEGNIFIGVVHRLDRPVSGVVIFAKTSKALTRLNKMFAEKDIEKKYWAIVKNRTKDDCGTLTHYLVRNEKQNKSYASDIEKPNSKKAVLDYKIISKSDTYFMLEVQLHTGRHHQIRCQLATVLSPIKGDLKYGFPRSNKDKGISLHARSIKFIHPVKKEEITIVADFPNDKLWEVMAQNVK